MGLSDRERISMIRSAVLTQSTRVTDGQTDRQTELAWHIRAIAYYAVARKNQSIFDETYWLTVFRPPCVSS